MLLVDGANVVGSVPDGWWRDRPGAAARLHARLLAADLGLVVLVLEGAAVTGIPESDGPTRVVHAAGSGDDALVALAAPGAVVVTADRELAVRCRARGAEVRGPGWLLERLPLPG